MTAIVIQGVLLGLALSFMIGPLFFSVMQATLEQGFRAGLAVAVGIWVSDIGFVIIVERALGAMTALAESTGFKWWAGALGGCLLIGFGLGSLLKRPTADAASPVVATSLLNLGIKGFMVNSFNPGTLVFWLGTATGVVAPNNWNRAEITLFFASMLLVLALTDLLKIRAANALKKWLTPQHTLWVQWGIGSVLCVFGVVLLLQALRTF
jgi:threonine/homoserine/homoserine lactone efflux protein